jgi:2-polyprenyl-6-methoxyphenol hydroxylase-like FAD-dependent oxidoreductase
MFLAFQGAKTVLVERHVGIPLHPRAVGWTPRTMELFQTVGIAALIPQKPAGGGPPGRIRIESLAGQWFEESSWTPGKSQAGAAPQARPSVEYSPYRNAGLPQDQLEPILRKRAIELGADIRFATELVSFEQDAEGVRALLRKEDGSEYIVRAAYLIAADGNRSPIREALGIGRQGRGFIQTARSVLFRPSIDKSLLSKIEALRARGVVQFAIDQPDLKGMLGGADGRWILYLSDDEERDEAALKRVVNQAMGNPHDNPEIIGSGRWEMSARIADTFASGRVFLVGDAAHALPPNRGGYGANTGIEDADNLAWKLAAVLSGTSLPRLLDTYDDERRPIAWLRHQQIFNRPDYAAYADDSTKEPIIDDVAMDLGQLYRSAAVLGAGDELPPALLPDQWAGQPGTRAPHLWLIRNGEKISTLDLFQRDWVLLTENPRWRDAAEQSAARSGVKLDYPRIGVDLVAAAEAFQTAFGIGPEGASLVRPDGYVAWRSMDLPVDATRALTDVLQHVAAAVRLTEEQI